MSITKAHSKRARKAECREGAKRRSARHQITVAAAIVVALVLMAVLAVRADEPVTSTLDAAAASGFELPSTSGSTVSLADHRGHDVLLYFNEGVGCDACFYQQAQIEAEQQRFDDAGLVVLPVVVNPMEQVRAEVERFGLETPYLVDGDRRVSMTYDTIGRGHHADLPGHSFVLVDAAGKLRWRLDEPSMFVEPERLVAGATAALRG